MKTYAEALLDGMKGTTSDISSPPIVKPPKLSSKNTSDKISFLDIPRELRDHIYSEADDSIREPEIERRFQWADRALSRSLPNLSLLQSCVQVKREYIEELARHSFERSLTIEIGKGHQWWRDRPFDDPWWGSAKFRGLDYRLPEVQTLVLIFHAHERSHLEQPFYRVREALHSAMDLSQRTKTKFIYSLDMATLREHLQTFGNILPAAMMRDAFYRSELAIELNRQGDMDDDEVETGMRRRRDEFENETVTIVHDKLFVPCEAYWEEHPKNRIAYKVALKERERVRVLTSEAGLVEGVNDVVPKDLDVVESEVMPKLTGSFEEVEAEMEAVK